ncbi:hypothetical protein [Vibrio quintilis]|uniref:hypothetical protein n=1 Tax=Vibrio quintilis TaxID=1117707 RepID=UPI000936E22C|nr:hypothetical protein [Vibrio quintilis]
MDTSLYEWICGGESNQVRINSSSDPGRVLCPRKNPEVEVPVPGIPGIPGIVKNRLARLSPEEPGTGPRPTSPVRDAAHGPV